MVKEGMYIHEVNGVSTRDKDMPWVADMYSQILQNAKKARDVLWDSQPTLLKMLKTTKKRKTEEDELEWSQLYPHTINLLSDFGVLCVKEESGRARIGGRRRCGVREAHEW